MSFIGRALARLAARAGGQLLLEMPDDLPPSFLARVLEGANLEFPRNPSFALFATGRPRDAAGIQPAVDFRELAMYRQGSRLAIVYASENRGMATYTSVYPLLLAPGFPAASGASNATGVAGLDAFLAQLADVLVEHGAAGENDEMQFRVVLQEVAVFLTGVYQTAGNGQTSFSSDWWMHVDAWTKTLKETSAGLALAPAARVYGCAGLPAPEDAAAPPMKPADYLRVLEERWADACTIRLELARLEGIPGADEAAQRLGRIDWEGAEATAALQSDSAVTRVAMGGMLAGDSAAQWVQGWAMLGQHAFKDSYVSAKGKLLVRHAGADLPSPWANALPILLAPAGSVHAQGLVHVDGLEVLVPRKDGAPVPTEEPSAGDLAQVHVRGTRGSNAEFTISSSLHTSEGLRLRGSLRVTPSKKSPNVVWIEAQVGGLLSQVVANASDGAFLLVRPGESALQARAQGKASRAALRGPVFHSPAATEAARLQLGGPGAYEFALACGEGTVRDSAAVLVGSLCPAPMPSSDSNVPVLLAAMDVTSDLEVILSGSVAFRVEVAASRSERPLSPVVAAATGTPPAAERPIDGVLLGTLEQHMCERLALHRDGEALGTLLLAASRDSAPWVAVAGGSHCAASLQSRLAELTPGVPTPSLLELPAYRALAEAYSALRLPEQLSAVDAETKSAGATISRISLSFLDQEHVGSLLQAYTALLEAASGLSQSDQFWARHPFTVAVYPDDIGTQSLQAILISPLHPVRLAWMWALQVGLREAYDDGAEPAASLALLDHTQFPALCAVEDEFGQLLPFVPVPVDAYPADVYLGWHALVQLEGPRARVPEWVQGHRFPVDGLSALSASAVSSAIDDFLRVAPHVQSLQVELEAIQRTRRSTAIDEGVLSKIGALATGSASLDGVAGVRVIDSVNREGPIPSFRAIEDSLALARPGFNAQWVSAAGETTRHSHLTFLEGTAATLALLPETGPASGWLARVPLRRFPSRPRYQGATGLDYRLAEPPDGEGLWGALRAYETASNGKSFAARIRPNLAAMPRRPNWLVTGDFGVDPQAVSHASRTQGDGRYMLWDWRPATTVRAGTGSACLRAQPYFVLASVPESLGAAIGDRLLKLNPALGNADLASRTKQLVQTLADRAVGLNTLLAIGHHQATGALGFYFALRSLAVWMDAAPPGQVRLVVPVDAVDPFLRSIPKSSGDGSRKRADLLVVQVTARPEQPPQVVLVPVEIKHYGLNSQEQASAFPSADEERLREHLEQLRSYQRQLEALCSAYRDATGSRASILGQQLTAILEAAVQLSPKASCHNIAPIFCQVAAGEAQLELGKGMLLWYQAGASGPAGEKAMWEEFYGSVDARHVDVRVDPAAFDDCFWNAQAGRAHDVVLEALDCATSVEEVAALDPPEPAIQPVDDSPSTAARPETARDHGGATVAPDVARRQETRPEAPIEANFPSAASLAPVEAPATGPSSPKARGTITVTELERRYGRILAALAEFHVKVERPRGAVPFTEGPAFVEYAVTPAYGVSVNRIESQLENLKLRLRLPADAVIGCSTHLGQVLLTVPKADEERYFVDAEDLWGRWQRPQKGFAVPLGEDMTGRVVDIELSSSNSPHVLIAGVTGSGKSEALLTLLHGAVRFYSPQELRLRLIDPKQTELNSLEHVPHNDEAIGWSAEDAIRLLDEAADEMDRRYESFRLARVRDIEGYREVAGPMPRWLMVLDEYADLTSDDEERKQIEKSLRRLAQKARAAGIHLIVSTQKPVVQVLNTVVKGNLPGRIALRVNTGGESRVVLDDGGAEQLVGKGDAFLKVGNAKVRLQFARFSG